MAECVEKEQKGGIQVSAFQHKRFEQSTQAPCKTSFKKTHGVLPFTPGKAKQKNKTY